MIEPLAGGTASLMGVAPADRQDSSDQASCVWVRFPMIPVILCSWLTAHCCTSVFWATLVHVCLRETCLVGFEATTSDLVSEVRFYTRWVGRLVLHHAGHVSMTHMAIMSPAWESPLPLKLSS